MHNAREMEETGSVAGASGTQEFCLRWNNYKSSLMSSLDTFKNERDFVDCTLACRDKIFYAHKMILSAGSTLFRETFKDHKNSSTVVILPSEVVACDMEKLLHFIYVGEVNVVQENLSRFLKAAELLKIRGLADGTDKQRVLQSCESHDIGVSSVTSTPTTSASSSGDCTGTSPKRPRLSLDANSSMSNNTTTVNNSNSVNSNNNCASILASSISSSCAGINSSSNNTICSSNNNNGSHALGGGTSSLTVTNSTSGVTMILDTPNTPNNEDSTHSTHSANDSDSEMLPVKQEMVELKTCDDFETDSEPFNPDKYLKEGMALAAAAAAVVSAANNDTIMTTPGSNSIAQQQQQQSTSGSQQPPPPGPLLPSYIPPPPIKAQEDGSSGTGGSVEELSQGVVGGERGRCRLQQQPQHHMTLLIQPTTSPPSSHHVHNHLIQTRQQSSHQSSSSVTSQNISAGSSSPSSSSSSGTSSSSMISSVVAVPSSLQHQNVAAATAINFSTIATKGDGPSSDSRRPPVQIGFDQNFYESADVLHLQDKPTAAASTSDGYTVHENIDENMEEPSCSPFTATAYLKTSDDMDDNYIKSEDMANTFHLVPQAAVEIEMHEVCDNQEDNYECITLLDMDEANEKSKSLNRRKNDSKNDFAQQQEILAEKVNFDRSNPIGLLNPISSLERTELKVVDEHYVLCPSQGSHAEADTSKRSHGDRKTCPICFKTITSKNYARHRRTHPGVQGAFARGGTGQYWVAETTSNAASATHSSDS